MLAQFQWKLFSHLNIKSWEHFSLAKLLFAIKHFWNLFYGSASKCLTRWVCSLGCRNLLNLIWNTMKTQKWLQAIEAWSPFFLTFFASMEKLSCYNILVTVLKLDGHCKILGKIAVSKWGILYGKELNITLEVLVSMGF